MQPFKYIKDISKKILTPASITYASNTNLSGTFSDNEIENLLQNTNHTESLYLQAGLKVIKDNFAGIEWQLFRIINSKGEAERLEAHEILSILDNPNPIQTKGEFLRISVVNYLLSGEAFWKVLEENGSFKGFINLNPNTVDVKFDIESGKLQYVHASGSGQSITYNAEQIIHIKDPNPADPLRGTGILKTVYGRILMEKVALEYQQGRFIKNDNPDGLLIYKTTLDKTKAKDLKTSFFNSFRGSNEKNKVAVIGGDVDYKQLTTGNTNINTYKEALNLTRDDIMTALGVPKSLVTSDDVNRANAEAGLEQFMQHTITPLVRVFLEAVNERFVIPNYGEEYYLDTMKLYTEDRTMLLEELKAGVNVWLTPNEARARTGYEPMEGGDTLNATYTGQNYLIQNAFGGRRNLKAMLLKKESLIRKTEVAAIKSAVSSSEFKFKFVKAMDSVRDKNEALMSGEIKIYMEAQKDRLLEKLDSGETERSKIFDKTAEKQALTSQVKSTFSRMAINAGNVALIPAKMFVAETKYAISAKLDKKISKRAKFFSDSVNDTTYDSIKDIVIEYMADGIPEVKKRIVEKYAEISTGRANTIARTEACYVTSIATEDAYKSNDMVSGKEWLTSLDDRVRDAHQMVEGQIVGKNEAFSNGEHFPGEDSVNCRCTLAPVIDINNL